MSSREAARHRWGTASMEKKEADRALCSTCNKRPVLAGTGPRGEPWRKCMRCRKGKEGDPQSGDNPRCQFGSPNNGQVLCSGNKKDGTPCGGIAMKDSPNGMCRMHNGQALAGTSSPGFKTGRYSRYLPSQMATLFEQALANPDLLEMSEHIALLEARIQSILQASATGDPTPRWSDMAEIFADLETAILAGEQNLVIEQLERIHHLLDAGMRWDTTWEQVLPTMEQLRKVADTEVKRKKELHQMVPIERIIILMAAVGSAVKRNVSNPDEIVAVHRELAMLVGTDQTNRHENEVRLGPEVIHVSHGPRKRNRLLHGTAK